MSEKFKLKILNFDFIEKHSRCFLCKGYLSCGPIRVLPDGNCICGRCSPSSSSSTTSTESPIYRVLALENILSNISFPCRNSKHGCTECLPFGHVNIHEAKCTYQPIFCPVLNTERCNWKGLLTSLLDHFLGKHRDFIKLNAGFKIRLDESIEGVIMTVKENLIFVVKYSYDSCEGKLKYDIRYCTTQTGFNVSSKIKLSNDSDTEYSSSIKATKCLMFDDSFYNKENGLTLCLSKYLPVLENPNCIAVDIDLKVTTAEDECVVNRCLVESLKCKKCQNCLFPPLFKFKKKLICCYCGEETNCQPRNDEILEMIMSETIFSCRLQKCRFVGKADICKKHYSTSCEFRILKCWFVNCKQDFQLNTALEHLSFYHQAVTVHDKIIYNMSFSNATNYKRISIKKGDIIYIVNYCTTAFSYEKPSQHIVEFRTSILDKAISITGSLVFEHQHCQIKPQFPIDTKNNATTIVMAQFPLCFSEFDLLTVSVHINIPCTD